MSFEDKGKKDGKELITVSAPGRKLAEDLLKAAEPLAKEIPNFGKLPKSVPADLTDREVALDIHLDGGALSAVTFDLAQLDGKAAAGTAGLPIRIAFGKDAPTVKAPADATELSSADLNGVFGGLAGLAGRPGAGPAGQATPLTDAQVKELARSGVLTEQEVRTYDKLGLTYEEIKDLAATS
ncbi:hypothetical protein [Kitasatospora sp. NPDC091207]|uniref:hypothetical protein n=1 Tax=Kitasatospora sp. NPDC091207 TaxID=3364083 RepID=UPI003823647E